MMYVYGKNSNLVSNSWTFSGRMEPNIYLQIHIISSMEYNFGVLFYSIYFFLINCSIYKIVKKKKTKQKLTLMFLVVSVVQNPKTLLALINARENQWTRTLKLQRDERTGSRRRRDSLLHGGVQLHGATLLRTAGLNPLILAENVGVCSREAGGSVERRDRLLHRGGPEDSRLLCGPWTQCRCW